LAALHLQSHRYLCRSVSVGELGSPGPGGDPFRGCMLSFRPILARCSHDPVLSSNSSATSSFARGSSHLLLEGTRLAIASPIELTSEELPRQGKLRVGAPLIRVGQTPILLAGPQTLLAMPLAVGKLLQHLSPVIPSRS
jgi:hypothetical protein